MLLSIFLTFTKLIELYSALEIFCRFPNKNEPLAPTDKNFNFPPKPKNKSETLPFPSDFLVTIKSPSTLIVFS